MGMSYYIKQKVAEDFFSNKVLFSWKTGKLASFIFSKLQQQVKQNVDNLMSRRRGTLS